MFQNAVNMNDDNRVKLNEIKFSSHLKKIPATTTNTTDN